MEEGSGLHYSILPQNRPLLSSGHPLGSCSHPLLCHPQEGVVEKLPSHLCPGSPGCLPPGQKECPRRHSVHREGHQGQSALKGTLQMKGSTPHVTAKNAMIQRGKGRRAHVIGPCNGGCGTGAPPQLASPKCVPWKLPTLAQEEADWGHTAWAGLPTGVGPGQGPASILVSPYPAGSHKGKQKTHLETKKVRVQCVPGFSMGGPEPGAGRHPEGHAAP